MFVDAETRDRIASYAKNLGDYMENGKPTATFRHDVPTHLSGVYKTLLQYGFSMSKRYGRGFKRNIRFDDVAQSFCVDVLLPGAEKWDTVTHEMAYEDNKIAETSKANDRAVVLSSQTTNNVQPSSASGAASVDDTQAASGSGQSTASRSGSSSSSIMDDQIWGSDK